MPFSGTISSDPPDSTRNHTEFFSWFETIYDENKPNDTINEIGGQSADVNLGMGGKYVWLRVHRAPKPSMMVDNFWTHIGGERKGVPDLAKGSGGDYRYFCWSNNMAADRFVTDVALWRTGDSQNHAPSGWDGKTDDINKGRSGSYLYLVWRTKQYCGPKTP